MAGLVAEEYNGFDRTSLKLAEEKFARLIIEEGVKLLHTEMFRLDALQGREIQAQSMETAAMMLKKHFEEE